MVSFLPSFLPCADHNIHAKIIITGSGRHWRTARAKLYRNGYHRDEARNQRPKVSFADAFLAEVRTDRQEISWSNANKLSLYLSRIH